jgi:hypothetical protein
LECCPDCGGRLQRLAGEDRVIQQVEIVRTPVQRVEHRAGSYRCTPCGKTLDAPMPRAVVKCGLIGLNLTALVAYLKGVGHASFSTVRKFLLTLPDRATRNYAQRLLNALCRLFRVIPRREEMTPERFQRALEQAREVVLQVGRRDPARREARNLAQRFRKPGAAYFQFITTPGIEPTNNLAEQAIRFVVIDRRIRQGARSEKGRQWNERIWTTIATLTQPQQGRSIFAYLRDAFHAYLHNQPTPALLPAGP